MNKEEYLEARVSFNISALSFKSLPSDQDVDDNEEILRAEAAILQQLNRPVRYIREMHARYVQTMTYIAERYIFPDCRTAYRKPSPILY